MDIHVIATHPLLDATSAIHIMGLCLITAIAAVCWYAMTPRG